jgi:hypothetical protein
MKIGTRIKLNLKETTQLHDQYGTVAIIPEVEGLVGIQLDQFHEIPSLTWSANDLIEGDAIASGEIDIRLNDETTVIWTEIDSLIEVPTYYYGQELFYDGENVRYLVKHSHPGTHKVETEDGHVLIAYESGLRSKLVEITREELLALGYKLKN